MLFTFLLFYSICFLAFRFILFSSIPFYFVLYFLCFSLYVCLSVTVCLSVCLSVCMSVCLSLSVCLLFSLFVHVFSFRCLFLFCFILFCRICICCFLCVFFCSLKKKMVFFYLVRFVSGIFFNLLFWFWGFVSVFNFILCMLFYFILYSSFI